MDLQIRRNEPRHRDALPKFARRLTQVPVGDDLPSVEEIQEELIEYSEVFLGKRVTPLETQGYLDLMEIACAYLGRALFIEQQIYVLELNGDINRGDPYYKLRTGQLATFIMMARKMMDMGSRRLSNERLLHEQRTDGGQ